MSNSSVGTMDELIGIFLNETSCDRSCLRRKGEGRMGARCPSCGSGDFALTLVGGNGGRFPHGYCYSCKQIWRPGSNSAASAEGRNDENGLVMENSAKPSLRGLAERMARFQGQGDSFQIRTMHALRSMKDDPVVVAMLRRRQLTIEGALRCGIGFLPGGACAYSARKCDWGGDSEEVFNVPGGLVQFERDWLKSPISDRLPEGRIRRIQVILTPENARACGRKRHSFSSMIPGEYSGTCLLGSDMEAPTFVLEAYIDCCLLYLISLEYGIRAKFASLGGLTNWPHRSPLSDRWEASSRFVGFMADADVPGDVAMRDAARAFGWIPMPTRHLLDRRGTGIGDIRIPDLVKYLRWAVDMTPQDRALSLLCYDALPFDSLASSDMPESMLRGNMIRSEDLERALASVEDRSVTLSGPRRRIFAWAGERLRGWLDRARAHFGLSRDSSVPEMSAIPEGDPEESAIPAFSGKVGAEDEKSVDRENAPPLASGDEIAGRVEELGGYVDLHLHSCYSLNDSVCRPETTFDRLAALGRKSVAVTDHGTLMGVAPMLAAGAERGIRVIPGVEAYVRGDGPQLHHLIMLAGGQEGWRSICSIAARADTESLGGRRVMVMTRDLLRECGTDGIFGLSACLAGEIPQALIRGDDALAEELAREHAALFPSGFRIELAASEISCPDIQGGPNSLMQSELNRRLLRLADAVGLKAVVTNDVHYPARDDQRIHQGLVEMTSGGKYWYAARDLHLKSVAEIAGSPALAFLRAEDPERLADILAETGRVAAMCGEVSLQAAPVLRPVTDDDAAELGRVAREGLLARRGVPVLSAGDSARLDRELEVINGRSFASYFLLLREILALCGKLGLKRGPGRGSAGGSLVVYALGITDVDPLEHGIPFERFLNPFREGLPDIDIDLGFGLSKDEIDSRVRELEAALADAYGPGVARLSTVECWQGRTLVRTFLPGGEGAGAAALISSKGSRLLADSPEARAHIERRCGRGILDILLALEGLPRQFKRHPSGIVIPPADGADMAPTRADPAFPARLLDLPQEHVEPLGLVKFDLLSSVDSRIVSALRDMNAPQGTEEEGLALIRSGRVAGLAQCGAVLSEAIARILPRTFMELACAIALGRPGPIRHLGEYARGDSVVPDALVPILGPTRGVITFQEQVMDIAVAAAGFTMADADLLRRAISKKKTMGDMRERFLEGARKSGKLTEEEAAAWFDRMQAFSGYGFNRAHAVAYAMTILEQARFKAADPALFLSIASVQLRDIGREERLLPPHVNLSQAGNSGENGAIRVGLGTILNVGSAAGKIVGARDAGGPFVSVGDFQERTGIRGALIIGSLRRAGAFAGLEPDVPPEERIAGELETLGAVISPLPWPDGDHPPLPAVPDAEDSAAQARDWRKLESGVSCDVFVLGLKAGKSPKASWQDADLADSAGTRRSVRLFGVHGSMILALWNRGIRFIRLKVKGMPIDAETARWNGVAPKPLAGAEEANPQEGAGSFGMRRMPVGGAGPDVIEAVGA